MKTPITINEVIMAVKKLNNNRAADIDGMTAELLKYAPDELYTCIQAILNDVIENHSHLDLGTGSSFAKTWKNQRSCKESSSCDSPYDST